jgi:transposase-like protein
LGVRVAPSVKLEEAIDRLLAGGIEDREQLAEIGRLGARLVLQRGIEDEVAIFLARTRHERSVDAKGSRNGVRMKRVQTAEGELEIAMPQLRSTAEPFVSQIIPDTRSAVRTRPLEALVIGAYVRGLSDRDIESLIAEAGLGMVSKSTVSQICSNLRARCTAFRAKSLTDVELLVLFLDAIYLPARPSGAPRRACWLCGGIPSMVSASCSTSAWASGSAMRIGWSWVAVSPSADSGRRGWW